MNRIKVKQLFQKQRELVLMLAAPLGAICGIKAVVLGGSHARGVAHPESDIDLGVFARNRIRSRFNAFVSLLVNSTTRRSLLSVDFTSGDSG